MRNIFTIAMKDLRLLWRDKFSMFWVLAFPLMMAIFFGSLMGSMQQQSPVRISIVDDDQSELSKTFAARLKESEAVEVIELRAEIANQMPPAERAHSDVQTGRIAAYIHLKKGFGESGFMPNAGRIQIGVDAARAVEAGLLKGVVMEAVYAPMRDMFAKPDQMKKQASKWLTDLDEADDWPADKQAELAALKTLLRSYGTFADFMDDETIKSNSPMIGGEPEEVKVTGRRDRPISGYEISFPQSISWGIFGCVSAFAMSLVTERVFGTYLRLRVSPVTRGEILAGKGLACFLACAMVSAFLLALGGVAFGVRVLDPVKLVVAIAASSACFVGLMMFTSVLGRTERAVAGSVWAIMMPLAMLGGSMVPQIAMPRWMQAAGSVSPVKWMIRSFEGAIWRDLPWSEMLIASGIMLAMGTVFYLIGLMILLKYDA
jgi:ABC-2 type transport system permease protein